MQTPLISVISPLPEHRGQTFASIASFANQTLGAANIEIIVPTDGADPKLDREVEQAFPVVRLIRRPGLSIVPLYNAGADVAKGKYLFITEMHCIAEPDCLAETLAFLEQEGLDCACSNSKGLNTNWISEGEQRIMEQDLATWRSSDRCKVVIRGFLIRRDLWQQVGGFKAQYDHFAELILGKELKKRGCKHGYAEKAFVHHCNQKDFYHLTDELVRYGYGQCFSNHVEPLEDSIFLCREWRKREKIAKSRLVLRFHQLRQHARLQWLRLVMNYVPLTRDAFFAQFVKHWETSIKIGRLQYLASLDWPAMADAEMAADSAAAPRFQSRQQAA